MKKKAEGFYKKFLLSGFYGWVNSFLTENVWNCLFFLEGIEVLLSEKFLCVDNLCECACARAFTITLFSRCPLVNLDILNIKISTMFQFQWYTVCSLHRDKKGLSTTPCWRSHIFSLSLNKCSKSETYISSVKPASFCSLHWMWSLLLTKIHFKDFPWKGLQGQNVLVCPSVIPSQNKQLFYVKCLDLKTGDTVCVFIRDDVNILHKDDKKKRKIVSNGNLCVFLIVGLCWGGKTNFFNTILMKVY